jgi:hypothetical protein
VDDSREQEKKRSRESPTVRLGISGEAGDSHEVLGKRSAFPTSVHRPYDQDFKKFFFKKHKASAAPTSIVGESGDRDLWTLPDLWSLENASGRFPHRPQAGDTWSENSNGVATRAEIR